LQNEYYLLVKKITNTPKLTAIAFGIIFLFLKLKLKIKKHLLWLVSHPQKNLRVVRPPLMTLGKALAAPERLQSGIV